MHTLVAIPVFNEERYLPGVLAAVRRYAEHLLVVDDGSTDRTPGLLQKLCAAWSRSGDGSLSVIRHAENRGYGQSLIDAFCFAAEGRYEWVLTMDCDEQHEPAQIPMFLEEVRRNNADVISGSRYLLTDAEGDAPPADRYRINRTINELVEQVLGLRLTDSFCGFKAHRVAAMQRLRLDQPGYAFPLQFWVQCVRAGLRIMEIPVRRIYRDQSREFGGTLDDPAARLQHYLEVFVQELRREEPVTRTCETPELCRALSCR